MSKNLKVFTFNLRIPSSSDGMNHFDNRRKNILGVINEYAPDLIGFQEATDASAEFLRTSLIDYTLVGCGRKEDCSGEGTYLAFRTQSFYMLEYKTFWLSPTPQIAGSRCQTDQSPCPRTATSVLLKHKDAQAPFRFINTHFDHKGSEARVAEAKQLTAYISTLNVPCILTGDFNALPDSDEIKILAGKLTDATSEIPGTFHAFKDIPIEKMSKIDYIFTNLATDKSKSFVVPDSHPNGIFISDHRPVCSFINI